jgi:hypothetical protein
VGYKLEKNDDTKMVLLLLGAAIARLSSMDSMGRYVDLELVLGVDWKDEVSSEV